VNARWWGRKALRKALVSDCLPDFAKTVAFSEDYIMTRAFAAAMRRVNRLMRPAKQGKATRSAQSPLSVVMGLKPKANKLRKAAGAGIGSPLGVVLQQLRVAQAWLPDAAPAQKRRKTTVTVPEGAQFLSRTHRSAGASRAYRLYLPAGHTKQPNGLVVMLHGCNQDPDDFARGTHMNVLAEKHGLAIVYPAQTGQDNPASCWNWFKPGNQSRGTGEPALLASLTRKLMRDHGLDRGRVFVAGLSAGGAMAAILADVYPDVFSAAGIHSGLARGSARNMLSALSAMRDGGCTEVSAPSRLPQVTPARRIVFQGDNDTTVHPSNAAIIVASAMGEGATAAKITRRTVRGRGYSRSHFTGPDGAVQVELWMLEGAGHAWSGGRAAGSYTDRRGPDASAQMLRFFLETSPERP